MCPVRCEVPSRAVDQKAGTVLIPTGQEMKPAHAAFACWVPSPQPVEPSLTPPSPSLIAHIQSAGSPVEDASRTSPEPPPPALGQPPPSPARDSTVASSLASLWPPMLPDNIFATGQPEVSCQNTNQSRLLLSSKRSHAVLSLRAKANAFTLKEKAFHVGAVPSSASFCFSPAYSVPATMASLLFSEHSS